MEKYLLIAIKLMTALTCLGMLVIAGYSFYLELPHFLTAICLSMAAITGFFSYRDIRSLIK